MKPSIHSLLRTSVQKLKAYDSARSLAMDGEIFLDANEAPDSLNWKFNRYPEPQPLQLRQVLSEFYGINPHQLIVGRGSDEAIDLIVRAFCEPNVDEVIITPPTYGMYKVAADIQNCFLRSIPLKFNGDTWLLPWEEIILSSQQFKSKIIFICSPNNPTGTPFSPEIITQICQALPQSMIVVDEAYAEFSPENSMVPYIDMFSNLIVLRTLSKAWALAGLRCGVAIAQEELILDLKKVLAPYPLPQPVIHLALENLNNKKIMYDRVKQIKNEKEKLEHHLNQISFVKKVYSSKTNFVLVKFENALSIFNFCLNKGIILRDRSREPGLENCLRITVGNSVENQKLLQCLKDYK
ncbi:MAG: histidinol-phosphate transaminase [Bdellovibrionales bacterium]|nr:histidinol-phosphate transaminase [Bdellovibrionales bacterium]